MTPATLALQYGTLYPFPTHWLWSNETISPVNEIPLEGVISSCLQSCQDRAQAFSFPHVSASCTPAVVKGFLDNIEHNAQTEPDMLALLFATLAHGMQNGVYDRCGQTWIAGAVENSYRQGDVWSTAMHLERFSLQC